MVSSRRTWSVLLFVFSAGDATGQMVFDDGQEHVIGSEEKIYEGVIVSNQSRLDVRGFVAGPEQAVVVNDAAVEVNGGEIYGSPEAILTAGDSSVTVNSGFVSGSEHTAIAARDSTSVVIHDGSVSGGYDTIKLTGESSLTLHGGSVGISPDRGNAITAADSTSVVVRGGGIGSATNGTTGGAYRPTSRLGYTLVSWW